MASIVNQEALDSNIYNPPADPTSLTLYQMMLDSTNPTDEATILQTYIDNFNNLPTQNQFVGIVVNPAKCGIDDINNGLQDVQTVGGQMVQGFPVVSGDWNAYLPQLQADSSTISSNLSTVEDHTDRLTSNLPSLTGIAQAALALDTVMNLLSNPCLGLGNFFGSLMDKGKALLNSATAQVTNAVNAIKAKISSWVGQAESFIQSEIGPLIQNVKDMISVAKDAISQFVNQVTAEITNFAKAMLSQVRQGLSDLLANLPKDPCLKSLLGSVVTGAAAAIL